MAYLKSELSHKNPYWLSKHRYLELEHFCRQYPDWKRQIQALEPRVSKSWDFGTGSSEFNRPVEELVIRRDKLLRKIKMVDDAGEEADKSIGRHLVKSITEGIAFPKMKLLYDIPCEKDMWYDRRRRFFWLLDQRRD